MSEESGVALIERVLGASQLYCSAVSDLLERALGEATSDGLAMSQVKLLLLVAHSGDRFKVSDVASFLEVTNAAASRAIDRLVQRGLVDRRVSVRDRRAVELALTARGEALLERFREVRNDALTAALGGYPADRLERVVELLDELSLLLLDVEGDGMVDCLRCGMHFREDCVVVDVAGRECSVGGLGGEVM